MTHPPDRSPEELAAARAQLTTPGACCGHAAGLHAPDGACRLARSTSCGCTGWRPFAEYAPDPPLTPTDDVVDAEVLEPWAWLEQQDPDRLVPLAAVRAAYLAGHDRGARYNDGWAEQAQQRDWAAWSQEHGYYPATGELS